MVSKIKHTLFFKAVAILVIVAFVSLIPMQSGYAQTLRMPEPGVMVDLSVSFTPVKMEGLRIDIANPFNFTFIMNPGSAKMTGEDRKEDYKKSIKYFLASLTIPNDDAWVNLSPYESDRIVPDNFAQTEMGRDLLAQDYILKQLTASLMYPEGETGKAFWKKIYEQVYAKYGMTDIPVDTFNKVWIMPDVADVYQKEDTVIVVKSHLKVMLEKDFYALEQNKERFGSSNPQQMTDTQKMAAEVLREVIVPVLEKEVNEGEHFAPLRQIYQSMIMATWYKRTLKESLLTQAYADKSKVSGVEVDDPAAREKIYQQYLEAFKKGVFNYIKEEEDPLSQEIIPRKYFSGGIPMNVDQAMRVLPVLLSAVLWLPSCVAVKTNMKESVPKATPVVQSVTPSSTTVSRDDLRNQQEAMQKALAAVEESQNELKAELFRTQQELARQGERAEERNRELAGKIAAQKQEMKDLVETNKAIRALQREELQGQAEEIAAGVIAPAVAALEAAVAKEGASVEEMEKIFSDLPEPAVDPDATEKEVTSKFVEQSKEFWKNYGNGESTPFPVALDNVVGLSNEQKLAIAAGFVIIAFLLWLLWKKRGDKEIVYPGFTDIGLLGKPNPQLVPVMDDIASTLQDLGRRSLPVVQHVSSQEELVGALLKIFPAVDANAQKHMATLKRIAPTKVREMLEKTGALKPRQSFWSRLLNMLIQAILFIAPGNVANLTSGFSGLGTDVGNSKAPDPAELSNEADSAQSVKGGIDMGEDSLIINLKTDGQGMPMSMQFQDPAMMNIQGLTFIIREIAPVSVANVPIFAELMQGAVTP